MRLNLIKSLWGIAPSPPPSESSLEEKRCYWFKLFKGLKEEGYSAVEAICLAYEDDTFVACLKER